MLPLKEGDREKRNGEEDKKERDKKETNDTAKIGITSTNNSSMIFLSTRNVQFVYFFVYRKRFIHMVI